MIGLKHIPVFIVIVSLIACAGCGSRKKDSAPACTGSGTWPTGTGTGPTGTGTTTKPTGTGTTPTGTGTNPTGTGTNPTGTGTNPTGTGTGDPSGAIIPCSDEMYSSGYFIVTGQTKVDGDFILSNVTESKVGWIKIDLSGIPTSARIATAEFHYTILTGNKSTKLYACRNDPAIINTTQELCANRVEVQYFTWSSTGVNNLLSKSINYINNSIASGKGFVVFTSVFC
ncbi:MAG: hypothetical protein ACYS8W_04220 [Planctomycetota bacterium]|jgi:hypothetical protein